MTDSMQPGAPITALEGKAFVVDVGAISAGDKPGDPQPVVSAEQGAESLSLNIIEAVEGAQRVYCSGDSETLMYVLSGSGLVVIGDRAFVIKDGCGIYVRANECFRFQPTREKSLRVLACTFPPGSSFESAGHDPTFFDGSQPERVVDAAVSERHPTDDRFYKLLAGPSIGCRNANQFIGMIPRSRGPEHYHEYEEAICILSGEGIFWTGEVSAPVRQGSVIFLPRGQRHCLECTVDEGLTLVGMLSPAASPAVRYET